MAKAIWNAEVTTIFCKLCVIEKNIGNRPTKFLSPTGYRNLAVGFYEKTGRHYTKLQFKNKWDNLRYLYRDFLILKNKATGLGWNDETNTVVADDDWWRKTGDENKDLLQFHKHGPENYDDLTRMFENINVTGESSIMPCSVLQEGAEVHNVEDDESEEDEVQITPGRLAKRRAGKIDGNPNKKNPVQKDFKRMVDHLISEDQSVNSTKNCIATEIEKIMAEVVTCGAIEGSDEYFIATKLFAKLENRYFFYTMKTSEGRMNWLRRMYEDRKRH